MTLNLEWSYNRENKKRDGAALLAGPGDFVRDVKFMDLTDKGNRAFRVRFFLWLYHCQIDEG